MASSVEVCNEATMHTLPQNSYTFARGQKTIFYAVASAEGACEETGELLGNFGDR